MVSEKEENLPNRVWIFLGFISKIGSIIDDYTYEGIYQTEEIEKYRDYESIEKCSECELLKWCRGCRAVVYGYTGDWKSADPQCWKECPNKSIEKCEG